MWSRSRKGAAARPGGRAAAALACLPLLLSLGCWEQLDGGKWFPQMKQQQAYQAFEEIPIPVRGEPQRTGFVPPEGTVPVEPSLPPPLGREVEAEADLLQNPREPDLASLENGKRQYETFCAPCHGMTGLADGPVAKKFLGVLPLVGVVRARSDGHIFTTIRYGRRRMPAYQRIPVQDRWDIVNYVRYLDQKGGRP